MRFADDLETNFTTINKPANCNQCGSFIVEKKSEITFFSLEIVNKRLVSKCIHSLAIICDYIKNVPA